MLRGGVGAGGGGCNSRTALRRSRRAKTTKGVAVALTLWALTSAAAVACGSCRGCELILRAWNRLLKEEVESDGGVGGGGGGGGTASGGLDVFCGLADLPDWIARSCYYMLPVKGDWSQRGTYLPPSEVCSSLTLANPDVCSPSDVDYPILQGVHSVPVFLRGVNSTVEWSTAWPPTWVALV